MVLPRRTLVRNKKQGATKMAEYKFGVTGQDRKALVTAISEILETKAVYLKAPTYGYQVGDLIIDKEGTITGELFFGTLTALAERGFKPEIELLAGTDTPENKMEENGTAAQEDSAPNSDAQEVETETEPETDTISITLPLDGFTPESLDNLCRMVIAKEPLIEKALGVEAIPIRVLENGVEFPWFTTDHSEHMMAYAQFITALCATAKEKKRVIAKPRESFENERFTMRVWLISLGLVGSEYSKIRQLMTKPLTGNGAWRYGEAEKEAVTEAASEGLKVSFVMADTAAGKAPSINTPAITPPAENTPSVVETVDGEDPTDKESPITDTVFEQIMAVRSAGECNMMDCTAVQRYAYENDMFELVNLLETDRKVYVSLILTGERDGK